MNFSEEILRDPATNIIGRLEEATRKDVRKMSVEACWHLADFNFYKISGPALSCLTPLQFAKSICLEEKGLELLQCVKWLRAAPANCRPSCTQTTVATSTCATQGPKTAEMQHNKRTADVEIAVDFGCRFLIFFNVNVMCFLFLFILLHQCKGLDCCMTVWPCCKQTFESASMDLHWQHPQHQEVKALQMIHEVHDEEFRNICNRPGSWPFCWTGVRSELKRNSCFFSKIA